MPAVLFMGVKLGLALRVFENMDLEGRKYEEDGKNCAKRSLTICVSDQTFFGGSYHGGAGPVARGGKKRMPTGFLWGNLQE